MGIVQLGAFIAALASAPTQAQTQTFVVQSMVSEEKAAIGAGGIVARDRDTITLATAAHTILPGHELRILDLTQQAYYEVVSVKLIRENDLAFIRVKAQRGFAAPPAITA